jgi:NitT/TauT family transport system substrate-binding protein
MKEGETHRGDFQSCENWKIEYAIRRILSAMENRTMSKKSMFSGFPVRSIVILLILTLIASGCAQATPQVGSSSTKPDHVIFALDWVIFGRHTPYFVALDKGYFADNNIDATILRGFGSVDSIKRLAAKQADFVFADMGGLVLARANENVKAKMVFMSYGKNGHAVFYLDGSGINTPQDLVGRTIAGAPGATVTALFPGFLKANKIDPASVKVINADAQTLNALLLSKEVDGMLDFNFNEVQLKKSGAEKGLVPKYFMYADNNFSFYANGIIVRDETIAQNPDLVRRFVDAISKGFNYTFENPQDACTIMHKYQPDIDVDVCEGEVALVKDLAITPEAQQNVMGYMTQEKVEKTIDVLREYMGFTGQVAATDLFTDDFLPKK